MTFPTIQYKATNTELTEELTDLMDVKMQSLSKFVHDHETDARCDVEFEKMTAQQTGNVHRVEANFFKNGTLYRAEATEDSFEKAVDEVRNELDKELRRAADKQTTLLKRGGRKIKNMLRFGRQ